MVMFSFLRKKEKVKSEFINENSVVIQFVDDIKKWFKNYYSEFCLIMYPIDESQQIYFKNSIFLDTLEPIKEGVDIKKYYEIIKSKAEFYGVELVLSEKVEKYLNIATISSGEVSIETEIRGKRIVFKDKTQESRVLSIIMENGKGMTPPEVHKVYESIYTNAPITSIRRALTKLTDYGYLTMSGEKRMGKYNQPNFVWSLKNVSNEQDSRTS